MSALMLTAVLTVWLGMWGPIKLSSILPYQTLISATIAAVGIAVAAHVAVRNVGMQLRINVIGREEERIEKTLPGLREAVGCIQHIRTEFRAGSPHVWLNRFNALADFDPSKDRLDDKLKALMPVADTETRQRIRLVIETILEHATRAAADESRYLQIVNGPQHRRELEMNVVGEARAQANAAQTGINFKLTVLYAAMRELQLLEEQLVRRVDLYEKRLPEFRRVVEQYFEN
ncbi:hypothetical protein [Bradyrhizobium sp. LA6.12]|uniref:hypothetical protein n=1 Tax=unclassified Bradyrhizobium TaxID=2631580 RepID=UPI003390B3F4